MVRFMEVSSSIRYTLDKETGIYSLFLNTRFLGTVLKRAEQGPQGFLFAPTSDVTVVDEGATLVASTMKELKKSILKRLPELV